MFRDAYGIGSLTLLKSVRRRRKSQKTALVPNYVSRRLRHCLSDVFECNCCASETPCQKIPKSEVGDRETTLLVPNYVSGRLWYCVSDAIKICASETQKPKKSPNQNLGIGRKALLSFQNLISFSHVLCSSRTVFRDVYGIASLTLLKSVLRRRKSQKNPQIGIWG